MKRVDSSKKEFDIQFSGLKIGIHQFEFSLDETFFQTEEVPFTGGRFQIDVTLEKKVNLLTLQIRGEGHGEAPCDRCTDLVELAMDFDETFYVKFGTTAEDSEEVIMLPEEAYKINLAPYLSELIRVHVPMRIAHETIEACNPEYLVGLGESEEEPEMDPRWKELLKLKDRNT